LLRVDAAVPPRRPPVPERPAPPPKRPGGGGGGGDVVPAPAPMNQNAVAKLNLVGGDNSRTWNLVWLFGGLAFAGYVVSMVPQRIKFLQEQRQDTGPALSADEVRRTSMGHVSQHALRKTHKFLLDLRVTPRQLNAAIQRVAALNVAGTGLQEVLQEVLLGGVGDGLDGAEAYLGYGACESALKAALITAERLAAAGLLEIEIAAPMPEPGEAGGGGSFDEQGEQRGESAEGVDGQADGSGAWSDAHSVLLLCLVARNAGGSNLTDEEVVTGIVQPLQFEGAGDIRPFCAI